MAVALGSTHERHMDVEVERLMKGRKTFGGGGGERSKGRETHR